MKIFLTGSAGMVGQNILEHKDFQQHEILSPKRSELDLFNWNDVLQFMKKHQPDLVLHTAGRVGGIQANMAHPVDFLVENIDINRHVIMAARQVGVRRLINLGSSCMFPRNASNPLSEDLVLKGELEPTNEGYALAKIMAQRLCQYISKEQSEFQYKTLIPCNLYGRFDKFDPRHSHLVPAIIRKLHQAQVVQQSEVDIWGDGTARREFMYVGDLVSCLAQAVEQFESLPSLMNVGVGFDYTVNEYYQVAAEVIGFKGKFVHDLSKPVGMQQKLVSTKLAEAWGWKSQVSLQEGLQKTYQYYLSLNENRGL